MGGVQSGGSELVGEVQSGGVSWGEGSYTYGKGVTLPPKFALSPSVPDHNYWSV